MDARREDTTPLLKDLQLGYPWIPTTPAKPDFTRQQPIYSNWQENHTVNQTNWLEPGILTRLSQVTQPNWSRPGEFIAESPNPAALGRYSSINSINTWQAGEASSSSHVYRDPLQSVGMWQASKQHNSHLYGADFVIDDKFTIDDCEQWNNMSFGSLLAMEHNNPPKIAPNVVMQADSAATNITSGPHFRPHVAASQYAMSFGNTSVRNLDSFLGDNMSHILGDGSSTATRPFFDLNAPCTTVTDDAALSKSISFQFEPITPYKTDKSEFKQDGAHMQNYSRNDKAPERDEAQAKTIRNEKKQSVIDQLPRQVQENHKLDKGGNNEADLSKTPQPQKPRRRKHRPKVVIEGQTKTTPRPRGRPPSASQETSVKRIYVRQKATNSLFIGEKNEDGSNIEASASKSTPTEKRKYVRRKGMNKPESTMDKGSNEQTDLNTTRLTRSSCRRSLNFNLESQAEYFNAKDDHSRAVNYNQGMEVTEKNSNDVDVPHDLTSYMQQSPEGYLSWSDKGKCKIVFSDVTRDKEENRVQLKENPDKEWTPPRDSICSNMTQERERSLKRQHSEAEASSSNATYNFMENYLSVLSQNACPSGMLFPTIFKKKRTEKVYGAATSSLRYIRTASDKQVKFERYAPLDSFAHLFTSRTNQGSYGTVTGKQIIEDLLALGPTERIKRKRSKGYTRMRDLASLQETFKHFPASPSEGAKISHTEHKNGILHGPHTCMEALVADTCSMKMTKKRSKRAFFVNTTMQKIFNHQELASMSAGSPLSLKWRRVSDIDMITDQLNLLDLNAKSREVSTQQQKALMPGRMNYEEKHSLVPYQKGGAIVLFDGSFDQFQRRRARPRVDLDDETTRVWKLLLEDINSEGVDGTDEGKRKWWQEERGVFKGRADSFIARMHLIQGDRRFSPWKGSVVDSVVGVFLTQNVSDHLSSSAFMSLAAHFPIYSKTSTAEFPEARLYTEPRQPEVFVLDADETTALNKKVLFEPVQSSDSKILHDFDDDNIRVDNLSGQSPDMTNSDPILSNESAPNKSTGLIGNGLDMDDALSSQISVISSQNSADSPDAQTTEITESSSLSNSEKEPAAQAKQNSFASSSSFVKLLQMAGTMLHGVYEKAGGNKELDENQSDSSALTSQNEHRIVEPISSEKKDVSSCKYTFEAGAKEASYFYKIEMKQNLVEKHTEQVESQTLHQESGHKKNLIDSNGSSSNISNSRKHEGKEVNSNKIDPDYHSGKTKRKGGRIGKGKQKPIDWDGLRHKAEEGAGKRERTTKTMDSVDWDAVRCADVNEIAQTIKERGMNNMLAERIKDFLNRLVRDHGSMDLEWLRDVPPDKAKEYLLSIRGLGLKSVECVRLLTLHHLAFPVDTNVGRIAVRLGWVPLQPLPESLQLHLLEMYPILESIQKYLWPRLCKLDQRTLYELHYQMITFGKVFCTKSKPNCNACPMRGECRHFASAFASARLALPAPEEKSIVAAAENKESDQDPMRGMNTLRLASPLPIPVEKSIVTAGEHKTASQNPTTGINSLQFHSSQPIIEEPATPEPTIELPTTPEEEYTQIQERDIENAFYEDPDEIPAIHFNMQQFTQNLQKVMQDTEIQEGDMSKALVALTPEAASIPVPKLKNVNRLRTEHQVYELPDSHPLLEGMDKREPDDPCPYLLAIWTPGETVNSIEPPERRCGSQESGKLCTDETCLSCNGIREQNSQTVRGTLLIPCRTAMRGSFPLNGTYFQVNEVFSDHESSLNPIGVPREWLWNLPRRTVYFGTSIPTIFRGLTTAGIQYCFWRGFVCVRGFDRKTRAPRPLIARLHFPASKLAKGKGKSDDN